MDGSIAIVNKTIVLDGVGTWEFNTELPNLEQSYIAWESNDFDQPFELLFSSGGVNYQGVRISTQGSSSWGIYSLSYVLDSYNETAYVHNPEGSYNIQGGWKLLPTIEVSYADNEAKKWLEAHARQKVKGDEIFEVISSLYVRENGEWVYKCEVV